MSERPLLCGFLKIRNENLREGDIWRAIPHLKSFCDVMVVCDDASSDGTSDLIQHLLGDWLADGRAKLLTIPPEEQDFRRELIVKQKMMELCHSYQPKWIFWLDGDEELEPRGVQEIRAWCEQLYNSDAPQQGYRFHYTQLWGRTNWARTDDGFDDGMYIKLWKWRPELRFDQSYGTHLPQVPAHIYALVVKHGAFGPTPGIGHAPWDIIHWGNYGTNLRWKGIQYHGGLGGVDRHLIYDTAKFRQTPWGRPTSEPPTPFSLETRRRIYAMEGLKNIPEMFTVIIPAYNRAKTLPEALQSLMNQTYERWLAIVLDDGSTDETPQLMEEWQDKDPRIFYARYPKWGAVRMNEIGMQLACEFTAWWTRLGSDDYFEREKLAIDAEVLKKHEACTGPYRVLRNGRLEEVCNPPMSPSDGREALTLGGGFVYSWANIAVRTEVLRRVKAHYGNFCDPKLYAMEDFLVNSRIVRFCDLVWRAKIGDQLHVNPTTDLTSQKGSWQHDAIWRASTPDGASSQVNAARMSSEDITTREIIKRETDDWKESRRG